MDTLLATLTGGALAAFPSLFRYVTLASHLKNEIIAAQSDSLIPVDAAPTNLPDSVILFLMDSCGLSQEEVCGAWGVLRDTVWNIEQYDDAGLRDTFKLFGEKYGHCESLWPPSHLCSNPACSRTSKGQKLQKVEIRSAILYTLGKGPIPVNSIHLECTDCKTTYYVDYQEVRGVRRYYDGIPEILQMSDHHYAERRLLESWRHGKATAWLSSANCASIYRNLWDTEMLKMPPGWAVKPNIEGRHVTYGFVLISLLLDCARQGEALYLPHTGEQADRFKSAMVARNDRVRIYGQDASLHKCTKCVRIMRDESETRMISAVVMDGVTVGRPRCGEPTCHKGLEKNRDCFCIDHSHLIAKCCVNGCGANARSGKKTCVETDHAEAEAIHDARCKAAWQYAERLKCAAVANPKYGEAVDKEVADLLEEEDEFEQIKAVFGRRRTHNEQLLVNPCGVIVARETFYNAETIPSSVEFIKRTYLRRNQPMPNFIIFDNNCTLAKHVQRDPDFKDTGLFVDVFHHTTKHSKSDTFCQMKCNPHLAQGLKAEDGVGWFFNTSIAEQTNVWFGGYHSICREMTGVMFDFFLDEMILIRNIATIKRLEAKDVIILN
ncbi:hypothetical protein DFP72DRAFT_836362 [Ephemerocybe angulata]|uniref:CxC5 like cysteine cluster associated with KDZ domain-containing protein n=1 Tax=Ephemerocybe angulata TaxID=980116 RepID=A0A8H6H6N2_9AGAR|nr:hypothetical protein DFP72DRAFT_836362 [Tulosesus angulatus]